MATLDSFSLYSEYASYFGANYGFRDVNNNPPIGNINGSTSAYTVSTNWYASSSISAFFTFNTSLYLRMTPNTANTGWQDIRVDSSVFNRTDASYTASTAQWVWSGITVPFGTNTTHNVVVTDNGQTGPISTGVNHDVNISLGFIPGEQGLPDQYTITVNPSVLSVTEGDTVTFNLTNISGIASNATVGSFDAGEWDNTSAVTVTTSTSPVKTAFASSGSDSVSISATNSNWTTTRTVTFNFESGTDTTPDAFNLGSNIQNADLNTEFPLSVVTVEGISSTATITASVTNAIFSVNDSSGSTASSANKTVSINDKIYTFVTSSTSYSTAKTVTLSMGGVSDSLTITTKEAPPDPQDGTLIPLGISSGALDLETLRDFFGNPTLAVDTISMSDLYKGGDLVPNITQNSLVPTSGVISLSNFYDVYTSLFIEDELGYYSELAGSSTSGTAVLLIDLNATSGGDAGIGYGALRRSSGLQYRFIVNSSIADTGDPFTEEVYPSFIQISATEIEYNPGATYTTPWKDEVIDLEIGLDYQIEDSLLARGTVTLEVRKVWNSVTYTASTTGSWIIQVIDNIN